jgi:hypothetical protein
MDARIVRFARLVVCVAGAMGVSCAEKPRRLHEDAITAEVVRRGEWALAGMTPEATAVQVDTLVSFTLEREEYARRLRVALDAAVVVDSTVEAARATLRADLDDVERASVEGWSALRARVDADLEAHRVAVERAAAGENGGAAQRQSAPSATATATAATTATATASATTNGTASARATPPATATAPAVPTAESTSAPSASAAPSSAPSAQPPVVYMPLSPFGPWVPVPVPIADGGE